MKHSHSYPYSRLPNQTHKGYIGQAQNFKTWTQLEVEGPAQKLGSH